MSNYQINETDPYIIGGKRYNEWEYKDTFFECMVAEGAAITGRDGKGRAEGCPQNMSRSIVNSAGKKGGWESTGSKSGPDSCALALLCRGLTHADRNCNLVVGEQFRRPLRER